MSSPDGDEKHPALSLETKEEAAGIGDGTTLHRAGLLQQIKLLMWKNYLMKVKQPVSTCMEFALPVIVALLLTWLRTVSTFVPQTVATNYHVNDTGFIPFVVTNSSLNVLCKVFNFALQNSKVVLIPNNDYTQGFVNNYVGKLSSSTGASCISNSSFVYMDTESQLASEVGAKSYDGRYFAAIVFKNYSPSWDYKIRLPSANVPATNKYVTQFNANFQTLDYITRYNSSGFFVLQSLVDEYILQNETGLMNGPGMMYQVRPAQFPTPGYTKDNFWAIMSGNAVLFFLLAFLWPFTRMVKMILEERTLKIKEGMKMMGVTEGAIWLSWFFTYVIVYFIIAWLLALFLKINIYNYSQVGYIFLYFFAFALSTITLGFLFTTIFKNVRTAIQCAILAFISGYIIYNIAGGSSGTATPGAIRGICLIAPACFGATIMTSSSLESAGLGITYSTYDVVVDTVSFGTTIGFFFLDCFLYLALTWYLSNVLPSEYGTTRPWWFLFDYRYWVRSCSSKAPSQYSPVHDDFDFAELVKPSDQYEEVNSERARVDGLRVRKLRKVFPKAAGGADLIAVDSVDLDMFEGEVFALLGHNGAGKTTTISMLTGLIDVSEGDAKIFGRSIKRDIDDVHNIMGVCPQQNVLFDMMTVKEHLVFFARLKGVPLNKIAAVVNSVVQDVGLTEKLNSPSRTLSGGQKRKLCVAISFIGDPKVVFLDEPTSGMDVNSRRSTWDLIKKYKKNRVIILTTHFMDEADLLADRIAIMAKGTVVCCGSSLFLKGKYGVGYSLIITKRDGSEWSAKINSFIREFLGDVQILNDVGGEILLQVPFSSSNKFPSMFRQLDERKNDLGVINYGVSVTTLEEVFLKVGQHSAATTPEDEKADKQLKRELSTSRLHGKQEESKGGDGDIMQVMKMSAVKERPNEFFIFFKHLGALLTKRWQYLKRDKGTLCCLTFLPFLLMVGGVIAIRIISTVSTSELVMDFTHYSSPVPVPYTNSTANVLGNILPQMPSQVSPILSQTTFSLASSDRLAFATELFSLSSQVANPMYGAYGDISTLNADGNTSFKVIVYANQTALHALPVYLNSLSSSLLKTLKGSQYSVTMSSHPMPQTQAEASRVQRRSAIIISFFFNQALIFVPSTYIVFIVMEKACKAKHQQLISGVSIPAYWISNFMFDLICYIPLFIISLILMRAMRSDIFSGDSFSAAALLFFLFGANSIPFAYILSTFFNNPLTARILTIVISYIFGPILSLVSFSLNLAGGDVKSINDQLIYIWRIFPGFNFGDGLLKIAANSTGISPWDSSIAGTAISTLIWELFVYNAVIIVVEYLFSVPFIAKFIREKLHLEVDLPKEDVEEDSDVLVERERVSSGQANADVIQVRGLRKVYNGSKVAVRDLWYGIPKGECFGFLGINGAGKTTTLEVLSGDLFPTQGSARLGGHDILREQLAVRRLIGYCPQFDALFNLLTAREHLEFYAKLKCVDKSKMNVIVSKMLHYLSLEEYADRPAGTYSGGNKRKLSVAMSLIGDPPIVFLDEPSTGMDPVARRFMWRFIADTMEGRSVILTTHSMDECEALCNRIGIMVGGRLRCLGTAQHLKSKFGSGYQLDFNCEPANAERAYAGVFNLFPDARLLERHQAVMKFQLPMSSESKPLTLADIFEILEQRKKELFIKEYSVSQTSLEQIFIFFAKQQDEERGVATGFVGTQGLARDSPKTPSIAPVPDP